MARPKKSAHAKSARERIVEAYGRLALTKPLAGITVADVCCEAGCNRTTLYYHFETFDLVEQEFLDELFQVPPESCLAVLDGAALSARQMQSFDALCTLLALNPAGDFRDRVRSVILERARGIFRDAGVTGTQLSLRSELVADGVLSVMAQRGRTGNAIEPRELARALSCLLEG